MNKLIQDMKVAVDKTGANAASVVRGEKTGVSAAIAIIDGVVDQNLVIAEYWRILLRDIQRLAGAMADRSADKPMAVKRTQVNIEP